MPVVEFHKLNDIGDRQIRKKTKLSRFDCDIQYLEGGKNVLVDTFLRLYKDSEILPLIIQNSHLTVIHPEQPPPPKIHKPSKTCSQPHIHPSNPFLKNSTTKNTTNPNMQLTYIQVISPVVTTRSQRASEIKNITM